MVFKISKNTKLFLRKIIAFSVSFTLVFEQAAFAAATTSMMNSSVSTSAGNITVDGTTNTGLDKSQNNIPIVNIASPNGSGLSHNRFGDFNVGQEGAVMNNSANIGASNLAGALYGNPNFTNGREANVILNEVTSNRTSKLFGPTEIFGRNADYLLMSPNGIACNGCGFINTPRVTLATGRSKFDGSNLAGVNIDQKGQILIEGRGLNASNLDHFDIVTRATKINAEIHAKNLNIKTGNDFYNYQTGEITSKKSDDENKPVIAIDSTALGGVFANRIIFKSTEDGVGVNTKADLVARQDSLTVTADGRIEFKSALANKDVTVQSNNGDIKQNNHSYSKTANVNLNATKGKIELVNDSLVEAGNIANINSSEVVTNNAKITGLNKVLLKSNKSIDLSDNVIKSNNLIDLYSGEDIGSNVASYLYSKDVLKITAKNINNKGIFEAENIINIESDTLSNNQGQIKSFDKLIIKSSANIDNENGLIFGGNSSDISTNIFNNKSGLVVTNKGDNIINANSFTNESGNVVGNNVTIISQGFNNQLGVIDALGNLIASNVDNSNSGRIEAGGNITLTSDSGIFKNNEKGSILAYGTNSLISIQASKNVANNSGQILSAGSISLELNEDYTIEGILNANNEIDISANSITNNGTVSSGSFINLLTNSGNFTNNKDASLTSATSIKIDSFQDIINYGSIISGTTLELWAKNNLVNHDTGSINSVGASNINISNNIINHGKVLSNNTINIVLGRNLENRGQVASVSDLTVNASGYIYNPSVFYSSTKVDLSTKSYLHNDNGYILSEGIVALNATNDSGNAYITNTAGNIESRGNLNITSNIFNNNGVDNWNGGSGHNRLYHATGARPFKSTVVTGYEYAVSTLTTDQGYVYSGGDLVINSNSISNRGSYIYGKNKVDLIGANLVNSRTGFTVYNLRTDYSWHDKYKKRGRTRNRGGSYSRHRNEVLYSTTASSIVSSGVVSSSISSTIENNGAFRGSRIGLNARDIATKDTGTKSVEVSKIKDTGVIEIDTKLPQGSNGLFKVNDSASLNQQTPGFKYLIETNISLIDIDKFKGSKYFLERIGYDPDDQTIVLIGDAYAESKLVEESIREKTDKKFLNDGTESSLEQLQNLYDNAYDEYNKLKSEGIELVAGVTLTQDQINSLSKDIVWLVEEEVDLGNGEVKKVLVPKLFLAKLTRENLSDDGNIIEADDVSLIASNDIVNEGAKIKGNNSVSISAGNDFVSTNTKLRRGDNKNYIDLILSRGEVESGGDVTLSSGNNIDLIGSIINSGGNVSLSAGNDVNITTDILQENVDLTDGNGANVMKKVTNVSSSVSTLGDLLIVSGNDTIIKGSDVVVGNNASITTGNELNLVSAEDSYYKYTSSKKKGSLGKSKSSSSLTETKTQVASNIIVGGNVSLDSVSDIDIVASNVKGENGQIVSQAGDITIENGINSAKAFTTSKKKGNLSKSSSKVYDYQEAAAESNLIFNNDLAVTAELGDVTVQGSNLEINNDLSFGEFTIAQNTDGSLKTNADGTFETVSGSSVQNVTIKSAELKSEHWEEHKSTSFNPINAAMSIVGQVTSLGGINPVADKLNKKLDKIIDKAQDKLVDAVVAGGILPGSDKLAEKMNEQIDKSQGRITGNNSNSGQSEAIITKTVSKTGSSSTTQHSSTVLVGGNLNVNANEGFKIAASNLDVGGDGNINAAKVDIISVAENSSSYTKDKSIEIGETDARFENGSFKAGIKGTGEEQVYQEQTTTQKASNVSIGNNLLVNSTNDVDIIASNIAVNNDATIKTGGNFNLSDAKNTGKTNTENSKLEVEVGVKVGNAYVDTGYAAKALADTTKNLKKAKKKLSKMKNLKGQGRASQKAVDLAYTQVALATAGVATATANLAMSAANAAQAASTSLGTGMYGAGYMDTTHHTDFLKTDASSSVGSTFIAGNNIDINAGNEYNQTGSLLASNNGDVSITAQKANIKSGESTFQSDFGSKTTTASVSVGNNGVGLSAGYNQSDNFILQNTHTNSEILAENGTFNLNTTGDTNIKGGNVTANKVALNVGGDLNLETLQDTYEQQGSSFGLSLGVGLDNPAVNNASISLGATEIFKKTTGKRTGIVELASNDNNLSETENLTNLLASNSVNVAGNIDNKTVKKDIDFTNADFEGTLSVPVDLLTDSGRAKVKDAFENLGTNLKTTAYGASNTVKNAVNATTGVITGGNKGASIVDSFKARQTEQVVALKMGANSNNRQTINNLGSKEQNATDIQNAVQTGDKNTKVYYNKNSEEAGFHDRDTGNTYINLAKGIDANSRDHNNHSSNSAITNATDTNSLLFTAGHERGHRTSRNEEFADMVGNEATTAWKAVNWIHGDKVNTNPSVTSNSWANHNGVGSVPITNTNQLVQNLVLSNNNAIANQVDNRDNLPVDTLLDLAMVGYDAAKIGYGKITKDQQLVKEGLTDLAADSAALAIPYVPAGTTKVARLFGKGDDVAKAAKKGPKLPKNYPDDFLDSNYINRQASGDEIFYRYHGKNNRTGKDVTYVTDKKYSSEGQLRQDLGIEQSWGTNIDRVTTFKPQKGTWISEGVTAPQKINKGGGYQGAIDTKNLPKSTIIRTDKLPSSFKQQ
ncbi:hemagglutinin repeat-containing protein [Rickettsiales bacterium]|nr:hemagglutinin repeat-containing protein [Rickettsiales bacterium]